MTFNAASGHAVSRRTRHALLVTLALLLTQLPPVLAENGPNPIDFDLRNWNAYGPGGTWTVADDGSQVVQEENGEPFFFVSPETVIDQTIRGNFEVQTSSDDDIVGFVFGYDSPTDTDPYNYDFVVLSWKQSDQSGFGGCSSPAGFTLTQINGELSQSPDERFSSNDFVLDTLWCHEQSNDDPRAEVLATAWDPDGGWADNTEYAFELTYTSTNFRLVLDGETVMDVDGTFEAGSFGFYNYSQEDARYSGFTQEPTPEPEPTPGHGAVDPDAPGTNRLPGLEIGDAVDVGGQICDYLVDDGRAAQIALARNDDFADALAGSQLPFIECILFTTGGPSASLDERTRGEIDRSLVPGGVVYILGGINAVSAEVQTELVAAGYEVRRLSGPTRFETAESIAQETIFDLIQSGVEPRDVVVAYGLNWPDAITGGAWVHARAGALLVLSDTASLHPAAARILSQTTPERTILVGGTGVLGSGVESAVPNPQRVAGVNRMATAVEVADTLWPQIPASGEDFVFVNLDRPDAWTLALAAAPLSASLDAPQLGVRTDSLPAETEQYLIDAGISMIPSRVLLGDLSFINDDVAQSIEVITGGS